MAAPIAAHTLEAFRRYAEGLEARGLVSMTEEEELDTLSSVRRVRPGEIILSLLDEIDRLKAAFVPRPAAAGLDAADWRHLAESRARRIGELTERIALVSEIADNCSGDYMRAILAGEIDRAEHERRKL